MHSQQLHQSSIHSKHQTPFIFHPYSRQNKMHLFSVLISAAILGAGFAQASTLVERATVNGPCTGAGGAPGVCISTTDCTAGGGRHILNACPGTPDNIRCCTKTSCGNGGNCRFTSQCSGTSVSNLCPGPASFKCCQSSSNPPDCYPTPPFPAVGACKQAAVDGARKIVAANRCKVREVQCTRNCPCPSDSDHCCGLATDLMVSSAGGVSTVPLSIVGRRNRTDVATGEDNCR